MSMKSGIFRDILAASEESEVKSEKISQSSDPKPDLEAGAYSYEAIEIEP